jgi:PAS domain S-box-containing protein
MAKSDLEAPIQVVACLNEKESIRVLLVDDDACFLKVAKECLKMEGPFEVDAALSVDEALNKMKEKEYDAVVSDYQMPGKDGLEFLKQLRKKGNGIPFIIFTGRGREEVAIKALNYGADRYLNKTGDPETVYCELAHAIRQAVDRRSAQIESLKREAKLNAILESSPEAITITDLDGNIVECNQATADLHGGQSKEDLTGKNALEFIAKKDHEKAIQNLKKTIEQGSVKTVEYPLLTEDGREFPGEWSASVVRDASGKPEYVVAITRDITERKKAEQTLRVSLDRYRSFIEVTGELEWTTNANGEVVEDVPSFREFAGLTYEEVKGWGWSKALHPDDLERTTRIWKEANATKSKYEVEYRLRRHDGVYRYFIARSVPVLNEDGSIREWVGTCIDNTERKKAEEKLKESEKKFKSIFEGARDGILAADAKTKKFVLANPRILEITGYSEKELLRLGVEDIHLKKDLPYAIDAFAKMLQRKIEIGRDIPVLRKDRNVIYCDINSYLLEVGETKLLVGLFRDVTERKNAEERLKEMNKRLEATNEKLHVVGSLTRHDVRNKLSAVTGNAYLLRRKLAEDPKALEQLNDMEAAVRLVERIFEFAGTYEKLGVEQLISIDVGEAVDGAVSLFSDLKGVKIVNECGGLTVLADSLLSQLFYNLIDNSLKYGEKIRQIRVNYKTSGMDQLELVYEDDGVGIPDNMRSNLFKEGFTSGKGTGYGLFMIKRICEVYGWTLRETGKQGKGAKFTITIHRLNKNGKENFQIAAKYDPKRTIEHKTHFVHISNSEENYSHSSNNDVAQIRLKKGGGDDIANQHINR